MVFKKVYKKFTNQCFLQQLCSIIPFLKSENKEKVQKMERRKASVYERVGNFYKRCGTFPFFYYYNVRKKYLNF